MLPQYRKLEEPLFHKFVVYSKFDKETGEVIKRLAKCNNCDALHRIIDFCKSEIVIKLEDSDIVIDLEEVKMNLPERLVKVLEKNNCDQATFEMIDHIIEEEAWGQEVVIARQTMDDNTVHVKIVLIKSENSFRVKSETIDLELKE